MTPRQEKLYPSTRNYQKSGDESVSLIWAINYLKDLYNGLSEGEKPTAVINSWPSITITYLKTSTREEELERKLKQAMAIVTASSRTGLSEEEKAKIKEALQL